MKAAKTQVEDVVKEVVGEDILPLVKALKNSKNISEFQLATKIKKEINVTRNMLYRLYDHNLVSFTRKKDKKKGWYIYYWTFNPNRIEQLSKEVSKHKLERLKERLVREESSQFYACPNRCIRLDFEQATNFEYKCPECGSLLDQDDNAEIIVKIKNLIEELQPIKKKK